MELNKMKAALKTAEGTFKIAEVARPVLGDPDWVIARVVASGICGTDLRHWHKHEPELECRIMGHELSGIIEEVGENVRHLQPGDRVVIETVHGDDTCDWCRVQQYNLCPHLYSVRMETLSQAFAGYVSGPAKKCYKLPLKVSFEEATLLDTFAVGLHALQLSRLRLNDWVVIIGAGPIGLGVLQLAKLSGARTIVADVVESSLNKAAVLGADLIVNSGEENLGETVRTHTSTRGADIVFECAGGTSMPSTLNHAVEAVRTGGNIVVVGGYEAGYTSLELNWQRVQMAEIKLTMSASYVFWGLDPEMQICLDLMTQGKLDAKALITHTFPLEKINEAFETANNKQETEAIFVCLTI